MSEIHEQIQQQGEQLAQIVEVLARQQNDRWRYVGSIIQALLIPIVLAGILAMATTYQQVGLVNQRVEQAESKIKILEAKVEQNGNVKVDIAKLQGQLDRLSRDVREIKDDLKELKTPDKKRRGRR